MTYLIRCVALAVLAFSLGALLGDGARVLAAFALFAALHSPSEHVREHALRPLIVREAHEHRLPVRLLEAVAFREQLPPRRDVRARRSRHHADSTRLCDARLRRPDRRAELAYPDVNAHAAALRLVLARKRCGGGPKHYAANFNGRPCGAAVYARLASVSP